MQLNIQELLDFRGVSIIPKGSYFMPAKPQQLQI